MLTSDLKAKEAIYEVVEPRYFEKSVSLSEEDEQGSIYDFLKESAQKNTLNGSPSTRATTIFR